MISGVYTITSPSGKQYVGSAVHFEKRWRMHRWQLKNKAHYNSILQKVFNKYGEQLKYEPLLICAQKDLIFYEQRAIDLLKPAYNICIVANSRLGVKASIETRMKQRGPKCPTHCTNLSKALKVALSTPEARLINSQRQKIAQNKPERLAENSRQQKLSQRKPEVRAAKAGRRIKCVENNIIFSCGHEAAEWCIKQGLTKNKNAFVWINHSIRDKRTAYGLNFINYEEV